MNFVWLLFSFEGRITRQPFWAFTAASMALVLMPAFFFFGAGTKAAETFVNIASLVFVWPALAVQAKRWHDRDKSAWWILINCIPFIGVFWALIENGFLPGTAEENRFGPNPIGVPAHET
jgi:uncharacterized membrane protein YhaH (DUF805 family)